MLFEAKKNDKTELKIRESQVHSTLKNYCNKVFSAPNQNSIRSSNPRKEQEALHTLKISRGKSTKTERKYRFQNLVL